MVNKLKNILHQISSWELGLILMITIMIFIVPLTPAPLHRTSYKILFTIIYFLSAMAVGGNRKKMLSFASILIILQWVTGFLNLNILNSVSGILAIGFFIYIVIIFIATIARQKQVNHKVIIEAINGYLLLSIIFSILISIISTLDPGAFTPPMIDLQNASISGYQYFSLVTMTTLGYGDIHPVSAAARSLSTFMAVAGQFYIAILVALLVGKFATQRN